MKKKWQTKYVVSGAKIKEFALASLDFKDVYLADKGKAVAPPSFVLVPVYEGLKEIILLKKKAKALLLIPSRIKAKWHEKVYEGDVLDVEIEPKIARGSIDVAFKMKKGRRVASEGKITFREFKRR